MFDQVMSSNWSDLPMLAEGEYVWYLEVIVLAVRIDHMSHEYKTDPVVDSSND